MYKVGISVTSTWRCSVCGSHKEIMRYWYSTMLNTLHPAKFEFSHETTGSAGSPPTKWAEGPLWPLWGNHWLAG